MRSRDVSARELTEAALRRIDEVAVAGQIEAARPIGALNLDARGYVSWWQEEVPLFNVMVHRLSDSTRHAGAILSFR